MILNGGELDGVRVLRPETVALMTRVQKQRLRPPWARLGHRLAFLRPARPLVPAGASFGHTGFTGTSIWIDPGSRTFVIFLGNRVHPDGKATPRPSAAPSARFAAEAVGRDRDATLNGIDVLVREDLRASAACVSASSPTRAAATARTAPPSTCSTARRT